MEVPVLPHRSITLTPFPGRRAITAIFLAVGLLCTQPTTASRADAQAGTTQAVVPVKDIRPGAEQSYAEGFTNVNGTLFFSANDGAHGTELWRSDGTAPGTVLVKDIHPGPANSSPSALTNVNGTLFFLADNGAVGTELWKSDGTESGTVLVRDINPGPSPSIPAYYAPRPRANLNGTFLFAADDGEHGEELWKSDGTAAGTVMVKDIRTTAVETNPAGLQFTCSFGYDPEMSDRSSCPRWMTIVSGTLFFTADDGVYGPELWKSDGTQTGTVLVKDIAVGPSGGIRDLTNVGDHTLFFDAHDRIHGVELWKSDGSEEGTVLVKDINRELDTSNPLGTESSFPYDLTDVNGTLFFGASLASYDYELWKTDGTEAGTVLVKDIQPGPYGGDPHRLTNVKGTVFFSAVASGFDYELWKSDGTELGTVQVKDINTCGSCFFTGSFPGELKNVNGTLFFRADDNVNGQELWKTDGTATGTVLVRDLNPGGDSSGPWSLTDVNGTLLFQANDGTTGFELWKTSRPVS